MSVTHETVASAQTVIAVPIASLFSASETTISIKAFISNYQARLKSSVEELTPDSELTSNEELASNCSIDLLKCPAEPEFPDHFDLDEKASDLHLATINEYMQIKNKRQRLTRNSLIPSKGQNTHVNPDESSISAIQPFDAVLSIALYSLKQGKAVRTTEFHVLASQILTELRDQIPCVQDIAGNGRLRKSSGFFFIENVFYNDNRDPNALDYSKTIIDWVNDSDYKRYTHSHLGVFNSKSMSDYRFMDLSIRLGYPYLYCHQGNCEHLLVFRDIRLVHPASDGSVANLFPKAIFQLRGVRRKCRICDIYAATIVTYNDRLAFENPCYFCKRCYQMLHHDADGKLLYEHIAVPFVPE